MNGRQTILRVGKMALVGALVGAPVAGCLSGQRETAAPLSLTVRAAAAAEAARVVRVIDADTYIMLYDLPAAAAGRGRAGSRPGVRAAGHRLGGATAAGRAGGAGGAGRHGPLRPDTGRGIATGFDGGSSRPRGAAGFVAGGARLDLGLRP